MAENGSGYQPKPPIQVSKTLLTPGNGGVKPTPTASRPIRPPPPAGQAAGRAHRPDSIPTTMLLCAKTGEMIHIRHIESINFNQDEAEEIVGKLAGDQILQVRTISGKEYEVSVREMIKLDNGERSLEQMITAIRGCFQRQGDH